MNALFERFANLSLIGKVLVLGVIVGVIAGLLVLFAGSVAVWVVLAGVLLVIVLVMMYQAVLTALSRKKSAPFQKALEGIGAMTPMGVTEPARRARLDDLRRVFESGVEKFRAAGKNLYALPWYLVVGEPGSGKTEAIRHCNVGFPPGLQDELQGSGGTLNMNWWFTNHAVLLDTAGRLMFEEVEPGTTSEWQEFLKLLKKFRPGCPINGLLLVIPAESLIKDTADKIEKKASRIARQLDTVQRTLGVRFPVFVVITKADLINGFREFFDSVQDPALQHQMLGWSNPAGLDEPFKPEAVDDHLGVVQRRLARRRMGLMLDPVNTENPRARRTDQVDALYAFPDALTSIAPRLRQYLSMIFVQGEWSAQPLFLRGMYFTSSMREGSALDADLAAALGVPVDQLPEGRVWERDRAFFLRDLFMGKVFRERGLVTTGSSTARLRRGRAAIIAAVGLVGLSALAGLTWFGSSALRAAVVKPLTFWTQVSRAYTKGAVPVDPAVGSGGGDKHLLPIVQKLLPADEFYQYRGDAGEDAGDLAKIEGVSPEQGRRAKFPLELRDAAASPIRVPAIFRPVAIVTGDRSSNLLQEERERAARAIVRASITMPLLDAARTRMATDSDDLQPDWSDAATAALIELLNAHGGIASGESPGTGSAAARTTHVEPLLRYALADTDAFSKENIAADIPTLDALQSWALSAPSEAQSPGSGNPSLGRSRDVDLIRNAVRTFVQLWQDRAEGKVASGGGAVGDLVSALEEFGAVEIKLMNAPSGGTAGGVPANWAELYAQLESAGTRANAAMASLPGASKALPDLLKAERAGMSTRMAEQFARLRQSLKAAADAQSEVPSLQQSLVQLAAELERALPALQQLASKDAAAPESIGKVDAMFLGSGPTPLFSQRAEVYRAINHRLTLAPASGPVGLGELGEAMTARQRASESVRAALQPIDARNAQSTIDLNSRERLLANFAMAMVNAADSRDRAALVGQYLKSAPRTSGAIGAAVAEASAKAASGATADAAARRPKLPLAAASIAGEFDPRYDPAAMVKVLGDYPQLWAYRMTLEASPAPEGLDAALAAGDQYLFQYARYWTEIVIAEAVPDVNQPWPSLHASVTANAQAWKHAGPLGELVKRISDACKRPLTAFGPDGFPHAVALSLSRTLRQCDDAQAMIGNQSFDRATEAMLANWRSLGADQAAAVTGLSSRLATPSGPTEFFAVTVAPADTPDLAQVYWRKISLRLMQSLRGGGGGANQSTSIGAIAGAMEFVRPPLISANAGVLPLAFADVARARELITATSAAMSSDTSVVPATTAGPTGDAEINSQINALKSGVAYTSYEARLLRDAAKMLASPLPIAAQPGRCKLSIVWNGPLNPGEESLTPLVSDAARGAGGQSALVNGPITQLGTIVWPMSADTMASSGAPLGAVFRQGADLQLRWPSPRLEPTTIPAPWGLLELLYSPSSRTVGDDRKTWEVKVPVSVGGGAGDRAAKAWVWIRMEFDRELPPKDQWPAIAP